MSKGQRGNKEAKKPKQERVPPVAVPAVAPAAAVRKPGKKK